MLLEELLLTLLLSLSKGFDHAHHPTKAIPELFDQLLVIRVLAQLLHVLSDVIGESDQSLDLLWGSDST